MKLWTYCSFEANGQLIAWSVTLNHSERFIYESDWSGSQDQPPNSMIWSVNSSLEGKIIGEKWPSHQVNSSMDFLLCFSSKEVYGSHGFREHDDKFFILGWTFPLGLNERFKIIKR